MSVASTLSNLSGFIDSRSERFLITILDFLVELLCKKQYNLLGAYRLGDALGKVILGTADCDPILSEKAGHFLTRMIIEHAKVKHRQHMHTRKQNLSRTLYRIDSGYEDTYTSHSCHSFYSECRPFDKTASTLARARHYDRAMAKIHWAHTDWLDQADGVQALMDSTQGPSSNDNLLENAWISIFTDFELLVKLQKDMNCASPVLYRILWEATKPNLSEAADPFMKSYLFHKSRAFWAEQQLKEAFDEFVDFRDQTEERIELYDAKSRSTPFKKLNHSLLHIKDNFRKNVLKSNMVLSDNEDATVVEESNRGTTFAKPINMKKVMNRMIKPKHTNGQSKERCLGNLRV